MKKYYLFLFVTFFCGFTKAENRLKLWYDEPAKFRKEALPIGNGKICAMIWGDPDTELIELNDNKFNSLPYASISIKQISGTETPINYYRDLDIENSLSSVIFTSGNIDYKRESFISAADSVMVCRISANKKGSINLDLNIYSELKYKAFEENGIYFINCNVPKHLNYIGGKNGENIKFLVAVMPFFKGGKLTVDNNGIHASECDEVILICNASVNYTEGDIFDNIDNNEKASSDRILNCAKNKKYSLLKQRHINDYRDTFDKVTLNLGKTNKDIKHLPTDKRLIAHSFGSIDPEFEMLYFQYARYLMISCLKEPGNIKSSKGSSIKEDDKSINLRIDSLPIGFHPTRLLPYLNNMQFPDSCEISTDIIDDKTKDMNKVGKINFCARQLDGNYSYKSIKDVMKYISCDQSYRSKAGGTYPNLFDANTPYDIDGNLAAVVGITEMLLQSYDGYITLLPAMPDEWSKGEVKGLMAKGDFKVNMTWEEDLKTANILSKKGEILKLRTLVPIKGKNLKFIRRRIAAGKTFYEYEMKTKAGVEYNFSAYK